ncbi:MAG TPA: thiamine pyrophosphate-binding protein [Terriglobales bacterium]|jgi:acetolactate synthase-1/2/3 large subunit|nr:thiamine pyrophosphate-binding protein [Terriglobales bacterium]
MRVADYVMSFVAQQGVKHVFLLTGGGAMHLNDALAKCSDLTFVCNHHEQASAIAAENYSKATNNLGVALVTTGPGGTNAITGVAGAWLDSTAMLVLSGQVKRADRMYRPDGTPLGVRQRGSQEVDIVALVKPITKYARTIEDPESIRYHLEKAAYLARTGRPGPVWIDIPIDVQAAPVEPDALRSFDPAELSQRSLEDSGDDFAIKVRDVIDRLSRAERPFIFAGNGVRVSGAAAAFEKLVRLFNVPVGLTWMAMDLLDDDDPLFIGRPGTVASRGANFALQNADFVLVIGTRLDPPLMGWDPQQFARGAYKTVVDIDPAELRKLEGAIDNPICADARTFIDCMLQQCGSGLSKNKDKNKDRSSWVHRCRDWKARYPLVLPEHRAPGLVSVYHLAEVIGQEAGPDDRVVSGSSGSAVEVFLLAYRARKGRRVFHTAGLGAMGYGIPASIGVCLGSGKRKTICVDGDGGLQLNIQELATIAHLQLPIKLFVLNNQGYASIRATQENYFGGANIGCDAATGVSIPDYRKVARAYGLKTAVIESQSDLRAAVGRVLRSRGPVLCDVHVIPEEIRAPRVTSIQRANGSFLSKPLEDLWPFLDRDEFAQNMIVEPISE